MPLAQTVERTPLHHRDISLKGYRRTDGLFDIEAHLTDVKSYGFENSDRGFIPSGEPLHEMWARFTVDEDLLIVAAEAVTDYGPYTICPGGADSFSSLAGLRIGPGFLKAARDRVAGATGCTHIRELLQQMATTAMQTLYPVRARKDAGKPEESSLSPRLLNSCWGYASDKDLVRRRWPDLYTGPQLEPAETAAG